MKRKIIVFALALAMLFVFCGCTSQGEGDATDPAVSGNASETMASETTAAADDSKYFEYSEVAGGYAYVLYNLDGSVAEEIDFCEERPSHELLSGNISKVTVGRETYYYDLESRAFSDVFTDVFDENGTLLVRADGEKLVICDIFDTEGFYSEIDSFTYELTHTVEMPFLSVVFIDGGGSIKCEYLSGAEGDVMTECFNITNGTKSVIVSDWRNKKDLIPATERDEVEGYLFSYMGSVDYNTGLPYAYEISGALIINGVRYYHCECFYVMENEDGTESRVSCAQFVLSEDKQQMYDCRDKDGELIIYTENDFH